MIRPDMSPTEIYDEVSRDAYGESPYPFTPFDHIYFWAGVLITVLWVIVICMGLGFMWAKHGHTVMPVVDQLLLAVRTTVATLAGWR